MTSKNQQKGPSVSQSLDPDKISCPPGLLETKHSSSLKPRKTQLLLIIIIITTTTTATTTTTIIIIIIIIIN